MTREPTAEEKKLSELVKDIEKLGSDPHLTHAAYLLGLASQSLANFVDKVEARPVHGLEEALSTMKMTREGGSP